MSSSSLIFFESPTPGQSTESYLDQIEESWNKRIDKDVSTLGEGLGLMIKELEKASTAIPHTTTTSSLSISILTQRLISSAESLSALTHQLKLWVVLSDDKAKIEVRDREMEEVKRDLEDARREVKGLLDAA